MTDRMVTFSLLSVAGVLAFCGSTNYAGSWNDASRLATIESLVDRHTWVIDDSVFVKPETGLMNPFGIDAAKYKNGTQDKLLIDGHFYSDKSPVPALILAVPYQVWRWCGGPSAADRPDLFCWYMSLIAAGGAFVISVWGIHRLARHAELPMAAQMLTERL